ncbi:type II secretion system protein [Candidatus Saccharibacteria bacterium]|jgi:type II secretory pathway pseudopilin PulG|nr:type II secretion system protein [Candidatus Saccharibacteria bacterium]
MKQRSAFTIVEIMIIVSVITILASIATVSYAGLQRDARNKERESDVAILQSSLEEFYEKNGYYPPMDKMSGDSDTTITFLTRDLNIPRTALVSPDAPKGTKNSISTNISDPSYRKNYTYIAGLGGTTDGNITEPCTAADAQCLVYGIAYYKEGTEEANTLKSKYGW